MSYAVVQSSLEIPDFEALRRAFRGTAGLTPFDAQILGNDAFGILVKGLTAEDAAALVANLNREGVAAEVVAEDDLPVLPDGMMVHNLSYAPSGLTLFDALDRPTTVNWSDVTLLAAGNVRVSEFSKVRHERLIPQSRSRVRGYTVDVSYETHEEQNVRPFIEIYTMNATKRYIIRIDESVNMHNCLGARFTSHFEANFALLVQDLIELAPGMLINRGAFQIRNGQPPLEYPSRNAFHEEIIWLLLRLSRAGRL